MNKHIKNEQWTVKQLISKVNNNEIIKPKYQRKKKWDIEPIKRNTHKPNEKQFIQFLYETNNSVHAITFGKNENNTFTNIDGNNRINAICHFIKEPFIIFPEYLDEINDFIDRSFSNIDIMNDIKNIFKLLSYSNIMDFKYKSFFNDNNHNELYKNHLKSLRDEFEPYIENIQNKLKDIYKDNFDSSVKINVNIFEGYNTDELCKIFEQINKFNSTLTDIELLACSLYNITDFKIEDDIIHTTIKKTLKEFYESKSNNEILGCYKFCMDEQINAYDFIVGLQNYSHKECSLIEEVDNTGLALYFKVYKVFYKGIYEKIFTTANVNDFINKIKSVKKILKIITDKIFIDILDGNAFVKSNNKIITLVRNNMFLLIIAIIGYINKNTCTEDIINSIEKCILYHLFVKDITNKVKRKEAKSIDILACIAGGAYIDNIAEKIYTNPASISEKITKNIMLDIFTYLLDENNNSTSKSERLDKRRSRKFYEKTLMYYYYKERVPSNILDNKFSMEHICPFSSNYNDVIDIDRLGNIIPIIHSLNISRNNKHISVYEKIDINNTLQCLNSIFISYDEYDMIISHTNKTPQIIDNDKYNHFCDRNEKEYIKNLIKYLYN